MKNKKGFLLAEETLKIIIAVISLVFLAYFLTSLYFANRSSEDLEFAKSSLEHLTSEISKGSAKVDIYNPEGWVLISWPDGKKNKKPNYCSNLGWNGCLCMSKNTNIFQQFSSMLPYTDSIQEKYRKNSDENGFCLESNFRTFEKDTQLPILINNPPVTLNIDYENKIISKK